MAGSDDGHLTLYGKLPFEIRESQAMDNKSRWKPGSHPESRSFSMRLRLRGQSVTDFVVAASLAESTQSPASHFAVGGGPEAFRRCALETSGTTRTETSCQNSPELIEPEARSGSNRVRISQSFDYGGVHSMTI